MAKRVYIDEEECIGCGSCMEICEEVFRLAGAGLSSAFVDALDKETMRTVRLIRIFRNELVYSDSEVEP